MAYTCARLACLVLLSIGADAGSSSNSMTLSILQQAVSASTKKNLRGRQQDPADQAIMTLDKDHDGVIQPREVASFAAAQGLDVSAVRREFADFDLNSDGVLSIKEVADALQGAKAAKAPVAVHHQVVPVAGSGSEPLESQDSEPWAATESQLRSLQHELNMESTHARAFSAVDVAGRSEVNLAADSEHRESMAAGIVNDLKMEETQEAEARDLLRKSSEMRSKLVSLSESTKDKAMQVGADAARRKTEELLSTLKTLEQQVLDAEQKAAAYHAKSKVELEGAQELMTIAKTALQRQA